MDLSELKQKYEELGREIERLESEPKKKIWEPKGSGDYWVPYISRDDGTFTKELQNLTNRETKTFAIFQTEEECQNFCNLIEAIAELKAWQKVYGEGGWLIYSHDGEVVSRIILSWSDNSHITFSSQIACEEIIPQLSENCKAYLRGEFS